ncbi:serine/threonine-protein kinase [Nonomuraea mangrovi]|uniref:non-specific serine/threonine protein kinase n=1 Tax=Nonomuraea mangrovi TaxID=2316207 RepID=A0ABW4T457_9ACTN
MVAQGTTLAGRYRLDTRIGAGGMGEVWRGEDIVLARTVAVKVLLPGRTDDPGFVARFQGEARAMATINHPGVVDVYDYGVHQVAGAGATVYLVMKFVDGEPLDRLLQRMGRIAPEPAMELIAQAASALQAVHDQGIVHRDVKPGNLLVQRDGTLVLTDFGIARQDVANRLTDAGMVLGTAAYCAPEQAEGAPVTPAVDIYALGVVAYECLVGVRPFDGDSPVTIALKHIREAPPPLPAEIPPAVRAVVERALSKDPVRRHPSGAAMAAAARQAAQSPHAPGPPPSLTDLSVVTGAVAAAPSPATGAIQPPDQSTVATQGSRRGARRAAKAARAGGGRGVLVAGIAAVAVLGVGAGAVALTGMGDENGGTTAVTTSPVAGGTKTTPSKTSKSPKPPRPTEPTEEPEPTQEEPPTRTPSTPPTTKRAVVEPSETPTPTHVKQPLVPSVLDMYVDQATKTLAKAGYKIRVKAVMVMEPDSCPKVSAQLPEAGKALAKGMTVTVSTVSDQCPPGRSPSPSPSPSPTPGSGSPTPTNAKQ